MQLVRRRLVFALVGVPVLLAVFWRPMLLGIARFMHVDSPLADADFILPLYRDSISIAPATGDLYRRSLAPRVLLYRTRPNRLEKLGLAEPAHQVWHTLLRRQGVPADAMMTMDDVVSNDIELGRALARLSKRTKPLRVIVAVLGPHSRLSRNALREGIGEGNVDLRIYPVTPGYFEDERWWRSRVAWVVYFDSYCLWLLSFIR